MMWHLFFMALGLSLITDGAVMGHAPNQTPGTILWGIVTKWIGVVCVFVHAAGLGEKLGLW
jgi:hypothetical protein